MAGPRGGDFSPTLVPDSALPTRAGDPGFVPNRWPMARSDWPERDRRDAPPRVVASSGPWRARPFRPPSPLARVRPAVPRDRRLRLRDVPRRDRADGPRLRRDGVGNLGRRPAHRRLPAHRRPRARARPARRPALAAPTHDRVRSRALRVFAALRSSVARCDRGAGGRLGCRDRLLPARGLRGPSEPRAGRRAHERQLASAAIETLAWMVGPVVAGVMLTQWGPSVPYAVNAVTFLVSAGLVAAIPESKLRSEESLTRGHWRDVPTGFAVRTSAPLRRARRLELRRDRERGGQRLRGGVREGGSERGRFRLRRPRRRERVGLAFGSFLAAPVLGRIGLRKHYVGSLAVMGLGSMAAASRRRSGSPCRS